MSLFISYTHADDALVRTLRDDLERMGWSVWLDHHIHGGERWWQEIIQRITDARLLLFALSNSSWQSRPCRAELDYAEQLGVPVIPVQVGPLDNRYIKVAERQIIDYRDRSADAALALMLAVSQLAAQPRQLPDPLPDPPPVPFEYLHRIANLIDVPSILPETQGRLIDELRRKLTEENDDLARSDIVNLLRQLRDRHEVTVSHAAEIDAILKGASKAVTPQNATRLPPVDVWRQKKSEQAAAPAEKPAVPAEQPAVSAEEREEERAEERAEKPEEPRLSPEPATPMRAGSPSAASGPATTWSATPAPSATTSSRSPSQPPVGPNAMRATGQASAAPAAGGPAAGGPAAGGPTLTGPAAAGTAPGGPAPVGPGVGERGGSGQAATGPATSGAGVPSWLADLVTARGTGARPGGDGPAAGTPGPVPPGTAPPGPAQHPGPARPSEPGQPSGPGGRHWWPSGSSEAQQAAAPGSGAPAARPAATDGRFAFAGAALGALGIPSPLLTAGGELSSFATAVSAVLALLSGVGLVLSIVALNRREPRARTALALSLIGVAGAVIAVIALVAANS